jgi:hypothetical protein
VEMMELKSLKLTRLHEEGLQTVGKKMESSEDVFPLVNQPFENAIWKLVSVELTLTTLMTPSNEAHRQNASDRIKSE